MTSPPAPRPVDGIENRFAPEFLGRQSSGPEPVIRFEVDRCPGWPGQAPSYQLGERTRLQVSADVQARLGVDLDLEASPRAAQDLDPFRTAPARLT